MALSMAVWRWISWGLVTLALTSGCSTGCSTGFSTTVPGTARPEPSSAPPRPQAGTAAEILQDPSTVDPCDLLDPGELARHGRAAQAGTPESFDYCVLALELSAGGTATLRFGELSQRSEDDILATGAREVAATGQALRVFRQDLSEDSCTGVVLFTDGVALDVGGDSFGSERPVNRLCELVALATAEIAERLATGEPVEHLEHGPASIGRLDACAGVRAATIERVLPGPAGNRTTFPARHQCRWGDHVPSVTVRYARGEPTGGEQQTVAGRTTLVYTADVSDRALCLLETQVASGELAQVIGRRPAGEPEAACELASAVAEDVWAGLPR